METPTTADQLDLLLKHGAGVSDEVRAMVKQFALEEFRRGYLYGKREMKLAAENAISGLRVEED